MIVYKYKENNLHVKTGSGNLLFENISVADNFLKKLAGLIFKKAPDQDQGLLLEGCNSIHTFWLRFKVDVVFLDKKNIVIFLLENLRPFRFSPLVRGAARVLEVKTGMVRDKNIKIQDKLIFEKAGFQDF